MKQCHDSGIKVVVDGVFNHTGREFFAFKDIQEKKWDSPYRDWYRGVSFDWQSPCGDSFGYEAWQGHFELPCLNLPNPEVRSYLFDVIRFWVDEFDIDGIRLDCANVLDFNFMKEMRSVTSGMKDDFWLMGEVIHGDYSRWVNQEMLHSVTNYELHKSLYSGFNDHNFFEIAHNVRRLEAIGRQLYTFVDNHDEDRIASKLVLKEHLFPIYLCLFTLPGIPSIYYGGEWGVEGKRSNTSDEALRPAFSMDQADELHCELTDFLSAMGRIHDGNQEFHGGRYQELLLTNRQYAFARHGEGSVIITAANNDDNEAELDIPCLLYTSGCDQIQVAPYILQRTVISQYIPGKLLHNGFINPVGFFPCISAFRQVEIQRHLIRFKSPYQKLIWRIPLPIRVAFKDISLGKVLLHPCHKMSHNSQSKPQGHTHELAFPFPPFVPFPPFAHPPAHKPY